MQLGRHTLCTYSKTQSNVALSSAESELYAMVRAASESLGISTLMKDFGQSAGIVIHVDASAALGIAQREGLGMLRHLQTNVLWLQSQAIKKAIRMAKVDGSKNPADMLTKCLPRDLSERHVKAINCAFQEGRAETAAQLHSLRRRERQLKHELREQANFDRPASSRGKPVAMTGIDIMIRHLTARHQSEVARELSKVMAVTRRQQEELQKLLPRGGSTLLVRVRR